MKLAFKYKKYLLVLFAILPDIVLATSDQTSKDFSTVLKNIRDLIGPFMLLIFLLCYLSGVVLITRGLMMLKALAMPLTQMSRQGEIGGPLVYIIVGSILVYLPAMGDVASNTLLGDAYGTIFNSNKIDLTALGTAADELLSYGNNTGYNAQWLDFFNTLVLLIQFVGFLAFARGWFIISKAGQPGVQPGVISKGIIHIVSGVIAINFVPMMTIVRNSIFGGTSGF